MADGERGNRITPQTLITDEMVVPFTKINTERKGWVEGRIEFSFRHFKFGNSFETSSEWYRESSWVYKSAAPSGDLG